MACIDVDYPRYVQQLIIYGTIDTNKHAKAAQIMYKPELAETNIPNRTEVPLDPMRMELTISAFFMRTVHMAAPMRMKRLPNRAKAVDTKNVTLCFATPVNNANTAHIVPINSIQYAALDDWPR